MPSSTLCREHKKDSILRKKDSILPAEFEYKITFEIQFGFVDLRGTDTLSGVWWWGGGGGGW